MNTFRLDAEYDAHRRVTVYYFEGLKGFHVFESDGRLQQLLVNFSCKTEDSEGLLLIVKGQVEDGNLVGYSVEEPLAVVHTQGKDTQTVMVPLDLDVDSGEFVGLVVHTVRNGIFTRSSLVVEAQVTGYVTGRG